MYVGLVNRNIGFITKEGASTGLVSTMVKWKRRSYSLSLPLAIKIGSFNNEFYFFGGGQMEMLYHYKEKEFLPSGKRKYSEWYSDRVNHFVPSVFVGFTFKKGYGVKYTYTLENMMNKDYAYTDGAGLVVTPYKYMDSQLFYLSFFQMVSFDKEAFNKITEEKKIVASW